MTLLAITIPSIYILVQVILVYVIGRQAKVYKRNASLLILGLGLGIMASFLALLLQLDYVTLEKRIFLPLELILFSFEYVFINLHFQFSRSLKLNIALNFPILVSWSVFMVMSMKYAVKALDELDELYWDISYNFVGLYCFIYVSYILYKSVDFSGEIEALIQAFGTTALSLGFLMGGLSTPRLRNVFDFELIIPEVMKAVGALIFISIYAINVDYIERMAINTYGILLFDDTGKSKGFYQLRTRKRRINEKSPLVPDLIAPFVTALQAFVKDIFGNDQSLKTIETREKSIIFQMGQTVHVALITEKPTRMMMHSLGKFQEYCEKVTQTDQERKFGKIDHEKVKEGILKIFPYVQVLEPQKNKQKQVLD